MGSSRFLKADRRGTQGWLPPVVELRPLGSRTKALWWLITFDDPGRPGDHRGGQHLAACDEHPRPVRGCAPGVPGSPLSKVDDGVQCVQGVGERIDARSFGSARVMRCVRRGHRPECGGLAELGEASHRQ
jgi:hypothetical protein